jgi:hypothetical protein
MIFRHLSVKSNKQILSSHARLSFEGYMALELDVQEVRREMEHKIFVSVQGGVAKACEETVPAGIVVEILDFDNFAANPESVADEPAHYVDSQCRVLYIRKGKNGLA